MSPLGIDEFGDGERGRECSMRAAVGTPDWSFLDAFRKMVSFPSQIPLAPAGLQYCHFNLNHLTPVSEKNGMSKLCASTA